ncbi:ATP-binding cassette domain-containing protein [Pseudobdellovibrio exovorus]|uniref:ABC transporter domain-containing protein n=1 Tax=Pseudobdellovibrio exovorus JSS TaxID=1184267 RepID=M4VDT4_9BACT|nr:ATP-binding cassette domain-containing protein [Pseudobdellovibrio exovorus]AGH96201.1 hypothetical protein A11Q_1985 [Pseudobdellovibrio exovorus JSS]
MLEVQNISIRSLENFSYSHPQNTQTLVLGASGSGKSTLLQVIQGHLPVSAGNVLNKFSQTGMIYQDLNLISHLSAHENAFLVLSTPQLAVFQQLVTSLGILQLHRPVKTMSMGERQRVSVAIALAHQPDLLLADEPTSHLDPEMALKTLEIILKHSKSLILVSHDHHFKSHFSKIVEIGNLK